MNKAIRFLMYTAFVAVLVILGGVALPKYASRLFGFGVFLVIDFLFYYKYLQVLQTKNSNINVIIKYLYWFPLILFALYISATLIWPVHEWAPFFKIYFSGILIPLFLWKLLLLIFFMISILICFPYNLYRGFEAFIYHKKIKWYYFGVLDKVGVVFSVLLPCLLISGYFFWVYSFEVKRVNLTCKDLPAEFNGFKMVQISDLHLGSWLQTKTLKRAIDDINSLHPDLVVFTGDLVNYSTSEALPFKSVLEKIQAPLGVYSILGNHDYGDYAQWRNQAEKIVNDSLLRDFFRSVGWNLLENKHVIIRKNMDSIALIGVENWSANKLWGRRGDLVKATGNMPLPFFQILLSHDPTHWRKEVLPDFPEIDLTLSGHTHAMQFGIENRFLKWSPSKWIFNEWAGLYSNNENTSNPQYLYVNRGLGHLGFPGRVGIRPEITLITLIREE